MSTEPRRCRKCEQPSQIGNRVDSSGFCRLCGELIRRGELVYRWKRAKQKRQYNQGH